MIKWGAPVRPGGAEISARLSVRLLWPAKVNGFILGRN